MNHLIGPVIRPLAIWAERSQRGACRNAMMASTALAARRQVRDDVQEYLDQASAERTNRADAAPLPVRGDALPSARLG